MGALADEEVGGGDDVDDGGLSGVVACDPECDGDVVRSASERDGEEAVETEEELGAAVVVRCGGVRWAGGGGDDAL